MEDFKVTVEIGPNLKQAIQTALNKCIYADDVRCVVAAFELKDMVKVAVEKVVNKKENKHVGR